MCHEKNCTARFSHLMKTADAFSLKGAITHRKNLIHDQNVGINVYRDREGKSGEHAAGVSLHWPLKVFANVSEGSDEIKLVQHLAFTHSEKNSVENNILSAGKFRVKAAT